MLDLVFKAIPQPATNGRQKDLIKEETHPIRLIVRAWKILKDLPTDGPEAKIWDRNHFPEFSRTAKKLLDEFGLEGAVECIEYVADYMEKKDLSYTFHTINKRSDLYREFLAKKGR